MILAAVAALTLASCAKIETIPTNTVAENAPIGFTNYTPRSLTKANDTYVASTSLVNGKQFAVYGWSTAYGSFLDVNPGTPNFMNPAVVTYNDDTTTGQGNGYSPVRYWPSGDEPENLSFTAYYPYGGAGITAPTFSTGVGSYAFTAQGTPAAMVDFCVADVINDQTYGHTNKTASGYSGTVNMPFKHMLTKVQFKFKAASDVANTTVIELVDAKLENVKTTGTLNATYTKNASPAVNALGTTAYAWASVAKESTPKVYDITVSNSTLHSANPESSSVVVLSTTETTVEDADIFLMIPQNMVASSDASNAQKLVVTWKVKIYDSAETATANAGTTVGSNGLVSVTQNVKTLYLDECVKSDEPMYDDDNDPTTDEVANPDYTAQANIDWARNAFVTYTITIGPKPIWFTATVDEWDAEQNGYFNVN